MTAEVLTVEEMYAADRFAAEHGVASLELMEEAGLRGRRMKSASAGRRVLCGAVRAGKQWRRRLCRCASSQCRAAGMSGSRPLVDIAQLKGDAAIMAGRWTGETIPLAGGEPRRRTLRRCACSVPACRGRSTVRYAVVFWTVKQQQGPRRRHRRAERHSWRHGQSLRRRLDRRRPYGHLLPQEAGASAFAGAARVATSSSPISAFPKPPSLRSSRSCSRTVPPLALSLAEKRKSQICPRALHRRQRSGARHRRRPAGGARRVARRRRLGQRRESARRRAINAAALTAIMVKPVPDASGLAELLKDKRFNAVVIGPGCGVGARRKKLVAAALASGAAVRPRCRRADVVRRRSASAFRLLREPAVLTPHAGRIRAPVSGRAREVEEQS